jgi:hypothetical protein
VAEITLQVPLSAHLGGVVESLRSLLEAERDPLVFVSGLDGNATITMRARTSDEDTAQRLEQELRLRAHERLRTEGVFA